MKKETQDQDQNLKRPFSNKAKREKLNISQNKLSSKQSQKVKVAANQTVNKYPVSVPARANSPTGQHSPGTKTNGSHHPANIHSVESCLSNPLDTITSKLFNQVYPNFLPPHPLTPTSKKPTKNKLYHSKNTLNSLFQPQPLRTLFYFI